MVLKVIQEEDSRKLIEKGARYDILYNEYHIPIHLFDIEMQKFLKLSIDLMPVTDKIWHPLMGKIINENQFFSIKKNTKQKAGYLCEICKGQGIEQGKEWQVEMHEEWEIYPKSALQRLKRFYAICPNCHKIKHLATNPYYNNEHNIESELIEHFMKINKATKSEFDTYYKIVKKEREKLLIKQWVPDLNYISNIYGLPDFAKTNYKEQEIRNLILALKELCVSRERLLEDYEFQLKLIRYCNNHLNKNKIKMNKNVEIRTKMLYEIMSIARNSL